MLDVCLLGCGGMMPLNSRWLTSALFRYNGRLILIDCGEGTQIPFREAGWGVRNLDVICFTHYHADHIAGLPGLLLTLGNSGRTEPLTLIGPKGLEYVVRNITTISQNLPFELVFNTINNDWEPFKLGDFIIDYCEIDHNVTCVCYTIEIPRVGKFDIDKAKINNVPLKLWNSLQKGNIVSFEGKEYSPDMVLGQDRKSIKVGYCTDTRPLSKISDFVKGSDLFICEGMYGDDELLGKAKEKKHMIFSEAANLAKDAEVNELWLTHFSPSMNNPEYFIANAKNIFKNTLIGKDLMSKTIYFTED